MATQRNLYLIGGAVGSTLLMLAALPLGNQQSLLASAIGSSASATTACSTLLKPLFPNTDPSAFEYSKAKINNDSRTDFLVRINSDRTCGTTGCQYELCIQAANNDKAELIPFGYATEYLTVEQGQTNGYHDLALSNGLVLTWDGTRYLPTK